MRDFLPIGSVLQLKGLPEKKYVITGYLMIENNVLYDYCGVPFPLGYDNDRKSLQFNSASIESVLFEGHKGQDYPYLISVLNGMIEKYNAGETVSAPGILE